jgi:hypothetical protein
MKNKYYIKFAQQINGYRYEAMGSDSVLFVDGRLSEENIKYIARKKASKFYLSGIHEYTSFTICKMINGRYESSDIVRPIHKTITAK